MKLPVAWRKQPSSNPWINTSNANSTTNHKTFNAKIMRNKNLLLCICLLNTQDQTMVNRRTLIKDSFGRVVHLHIQVNEHKTQICSCLL